MKQFDSITAGSFDIAYAKSLELKNTEVTPYHLLWGLILNPQSSSSKAFKAQKGKLEGFLKGLPQTTAPMTIDGLRASAQLSEWITLSSSHAIQEGRGEVGERDLLKFINKFIIEIELNLENLKDNVEQTDTPSFLVNLNELAEQGKLDPVIGRSSEIRAVMEILGRRSKNNPCLVGNAGVGKTAIVEGLALAISKAEVPDVLKGKTVYSLDLGSLMAGTKFRGEFEERIQNLLKYIKEQAGEAILFIDEIHQIVGAGKTDGAMDAANLLKPALARGDLHCIGATTQDEFQKYIMGDSALERRFRSVVVNEPSKEDAVEILMGVREKLEIHHGIKISDDAIFSSVMLSDQYITNKFLPDKAIDLVDEAASAMKLSAEAMPAELIALEAEIRTKMINAQIGSDKEKLKAEAQELQKDFDNKKATWEKEVLSVKRVSEIKNNLDRAKFELEQLQRAGDYEKASELMYSRIPELEKELEGQAHDWILGKSHIAKVIARQTGIPVEKILQDKQDNILKLEDFLNSKVFGQEKSLHEVSETLIATHAGLTEETRPLGSFLLLGPSGVGKTETAKSLADFLFNNPENIIRMDMSEYSEKHAVSKLIGAAPGYIGYEEGGVLTEAVRRKPYSVLLFDEIEKAHPDFSDMLLQILDDGRLTDNKGRTISFRNTIILLTSNVADHEAFFKPEVLGRLDSILVYEKLDGKVVRKVIDKELNYLNKRLGDKKLILNLNESVYKVLEEQGISEKYGARPLKSTFNRLITRPLSKKILSGSLDSGSLEASFEEGQIVFS